MGGFGSGSHWTSKRDVVEDCYSLDANRWMREGILKIGISQSGRWIWYRDGERKEETSSIGYAVNTLASPPWVQLIYTISRTKEEMDYKLQLLTTQPRFGGLRWWFQCPLVVQNVACRRRVGKLYLPPGGRYYGCRHCYDLTYTSCQESHRFDGLFRHMAADLGWGLDDVKWAMKQIEKRR